MINRTFPRPHTLLLAALTLIGFSLPLSGGWAAVFSPETFELENGMQVVVVPNHRAPVVTQYPAMGRTLSGSRPARRAR